MEVAFHQIFMKDRDTITFKVFEFVTAGNFTEYTIAHDQISHIGRPSREGKNGWPETSNSIIVYIKGCYHILVENRETADAIVEFYKREL